MSIWRNLLLLIMALAVLPLIGAVAQAPVSDFRIVKGPIYSADKLRARAVQGVRLGMPLARADKLLAGQGFRLKSQKSAKAGDLGLRGDGEQTFVRVDGEEFRLSYGPSAGGQPAVIWIRYLMPVVSKSRTREQWRQAMVDQYGAPSEWVQWDVTAGLQDTLRYLGASTLLDDGQRRMVGTCATLWQCQDPQAAVDCRDVLQKAGGAELEIGFIFNAISFEWTDYAGVYRFLMQDPDFRAQQGFTDRCVIQPPPPIGPG